MVIYSKKEVVNLISKNQEKYLRIIDKTPLSFKELAIKFNVSECQVYEIFDGDEMDSYIAKTSSGAVKTSETGKAALQNINKDKWRFRIPLIISLIALIGAYRHELRLLIQVLMK